MTLSTQSKVRTAIMPSQAIVEQTDRYTVTSHGNGWGYEFYRKPGGWSGWLQDDDAAQWRKDYEAMCIAAVNPDSVWYGRPWNRCLAELIDSYLREPLR